ncbi:MarR family winged helix-turn-helix transcriptional regulator [Amycolatopsis sp. H20-H5]|uniref:MarR family winged helix-turn-helix transcriptional regulator n=1 Tax=Amycolatopsis sp. H20-H5 TaxID=3046309 RepID=UPI002DB7EB99|nr:MarR family winged helix-turn-helix transcriptional regulator [Amycolatopsis sp. H20-H5]MEC3974670.1 MarR family winged helix-turn-helix transcriptional regulator [Amycolatopsis sp. H20-H5]
MTDPVVEVERAMIAIRRSQARRALSKIARPRAADAPEQAVMELLDVVEEYTDRGEPSTVTTLGTALGVDQPRASRLVARAVDLGLLKREADQSDGRRTVLTPTEAGTASLNKMHAFRQAVFAEAMANWSPADQQTFARLLTDFITNYTKKTHKS